MRRRRYHPRQALPREHTRHHVADALALGAFGVRWAAERTLAHDAELRARATPTSRMGRRGARFRVTHMESYLKQFRGQAKGSSCVHASQRSTSGQPGECRLLSSPQRRRGELRAHWDAGDRLERGQAHRRQIVRWFKCLCSPHARDRSTFGRLTQWQGETLRSSSSYGNEVSGDDRTWKKT